MMLEEVIKLPQDAVPQIHNTQMDSVFCSPTGSPQTSVSVHRAWPGPSSASTQEEEINQHLNSDIYRYICDKNSKKSSSQALQPFYFMTDETLDYTTVLLLAFIKYVYGPQIAGLLRDVALFGVCGIKSSER